MKLVDDQKPWLFRRVGLQVIKQNHLEKNLPGTCLQARMLIEPGPLGPSYCLALRYFVSFIEIRRLPSTPNIAVRAPLEKNAQVGAYRQCEYC